HYQCPTPEGEFLAVVDLLGMHLRVIRPRTGWTERHPLKVCLPNRKREERQEQPAGAADRPASDHLATLQALLRAQEPVAVIALRRVGDHDMVWVRHGASYSVSVGPGSSGTLPRVGPPSFGTLPPMPWCCAPPRDPMPRGASPSIAAPRTAAPARM